MAPRPSVLSERALGALFVAVASVFFGGVVVLGKVASNEGVPVPSMLAVRFGVASAVLALIQVARRRTLRPARGEGIPLVALGAAGYALEASLFFFAIERGTASAVALLFFSYPVIVTLVAALLGRGIPGPLVLGSLAAAVAGSGLIVTGSGGVDISGSGIAFALLAACAYTGYLLGIEAALHGTESIVAAAWVAASASLALALWSAAGGGRAPSGAAEWWPIVGMGVFTAGAFLFLFAGVRRVGAVRTAIVAAMEPLSTAVLAIAFLAEPARAQTLFGGALILAAATVASVARRGADPTEPADETRVP